MRVVPLLLCFSLELVCSRRVSFRFSIMFWWITAAWPSGWEHRFYDGHDRKVDGLTLTQAWMLRPWIRCFMAIISAWRNLTSSKLKKSEAKFERKNQTHGQLLSESGFVPCIAPPSLSHDRRIKIKKSSSSRTVELFENAQHIFCMLFSNYKRSTVYSELIICCYNMDIKDFLPSKVMLGHELIAKIKLICW